MLSRDLKDGIFDVRRGNRFRSRRSRRTIWVGGAIALLVAFVVRSRLQVADPELVASDGLLELEAPEIRLPFEADELVESGAPDVTPSRVDGRIEPGGSISAALASDGVPVPSIGPAVNALATVYDFRRSQPGHEYEAELDGDGAIVRLRYQTAPEYYFEARNGETGWFAERVNLPVEISVHTIGGNVETTVSAAIVEAGESDALVRSLVDVLQWEVDFSSDIRVGDAFRLLYEKVWLEGEFLRYGRVLGVEYRGSQARAAAWYFDEPGYEGWYTTEGESTQRMFLAAPCRYRRISSRFDPNRMHPILNVRRPHMGVDYAASVGTPVYAAADGTVSFVGRRGGNGNLIVLRHAGGYETGYSHLNGFVRGLRHGQEVVQGQLIGYVGNTGLSTGPHLHYSLKLDGNFIDPLGERPRRGAALSGRLLADFRRRQSQLAAELEEVAIVDVELREDTGSWMGEVMEIHHVDLDELSY
jgi:murein DD-endopeptidase MepM/ murein hydrolase activator NlpD